MRINKLIMPTALAAALVSGCGGSGSSGPSQLDFGYIPGAGEVYMYPVPPAMTPPTGGSSLLTVYRTTQFAANAQDYTNGYETSTSQVAYGAVANVNPSSVQVIVFAYTNEYCVQPLTGCYVHINANGSWICPANAGAIHAVLIKNGYNFFANFNGTSLPPVDGVNILAET